MPPDQVLIVERPGLVRLLATEAPQDLAEGTFLARTVYSGLSAGTELSYVRGTNPYLSARWDSELGLFCPGHPGQRYPVSRLGYMEVARIVESVPLRYSPVASLRWRTDTAAAMSVTR